MLKKPKLVILDEATSSLDPIGEAQINSYIEEVEISMFIISHRLSSIVKCNRIYVLNNNQIIEHGNHKVLLENKGLYHQL